MHLVENMAYVGATPWHCLGNQLTPKQPLEVWARAAGMADRDGLAVNERAIKAVAQLYTGRGMGADLASASGTAWDLVNAITEFTDHHRRARSGDHRRDAAWFGAGATLKQRAWDEAMRLVA